MLKGRYAGFPAISLHDDDVVYIMDKHEFLDKKASVAAVDMKNQTVTGGILGYTQVYIPSGISRYMSLVLCQVIMCRCGNIYASGS